MTTVEAVASMVSVSYRAKDEHLSKRSTIRAP
jgi:hypothetical protein